MLGGDEVAGYGLGVFFVNRQQTTDDNIDDDDEFRLLTFAMGGELFLLRV